MQGDNTYHDSHFDYIMDKCGITDPDVIKRIHGMLKTGVDGNPNATDEEIIDAIESLGEGE
jgi:hypothetical protein